MNIVTKAEIFATKAHDGQVRKAYLGNGEKIPYIAHPKDVALTLKGYGFNDEVTSGGHLHDITEETQYTLNDIKYHFGSKVASLVEGASEEDKSLSWEVRKAKTIDKVKTLGLEHKAIVCCDKICNLRDMTILFGKNGKVNFDCFNRGIEQQKWYYENIYRSLIHGQDENLEMFKELKQLITLIFEKPDLFKEDYISILKYKHQELAKLKKLFGCQYPNIDEIAFNNIDKNTYQTIRYILDTVDIGITVPTNPDCYVYTKELPNITDSQQATKAIIDSLMDELYQETITGVKRKIKEKINNNP